MAITLAEWRHYHTVIQVYRSLHKISPSYLHNTFYYAVEITDRDARNEHRLFVPRVRTSLAKNGFTSEELNFGILLIPPSMQQRN